MRHETEVMIVCLLAGILSWLTPYPWWADFPILFFTGSFIVAYS